LELIKAVAEGASTPVKIAISDKTTIISSRVKPEQAR
jgi:hypothetical protein